MVEWIEQEMAEEERDNALQEEILQLMEDHGDRMNDDDDAIPRRNAQEVPPNVPAPDDIPLGEEWENVIPADIVDHPVITAFQSSDANFLISDPRIAGNPVIYASKGFLELTGYPVERVLGRNCRFLQGPETDPVAVAQMREAIDRGDDVHVTVLNYRYDGSTFRNEVMISGIRHPYTNHVLYFVGLQCIVDEMGIPIEP
ncbi:PAS domain containing protein [Nitzschia inconspicua]|uniref:PAS domain containing protein n=1 Tax=Nitzschia inconspicua TaxID=303405 RepID=A0A9K3KDB8_9STRA|nr:PAS domain containing protein [Nitzschia inconspicua]